MRPYSETFSKIPVPNDTLSSSQRGRSTSRNPFCTPVESPKMTQKLSQTTPNTPIRRTSSVPTKVLGESAKKSTSKKQNEKENDVGTRLFKRAKEIERKKENIRKNSQPEYTFTPVLSEGTEK